MKFFKNLRYSLLILIIVILEQTVAKHLTIFGACPMLTLCFCFAASMLEEKPSYVLGVSLACGILCDLLSMHGFGTYTITYTLASLIIYRFHNKLFSSEYLFLTFSSFFATIFVQLIYFVLHIRAIGAHSFGSGFVSIILPMAFYNTVISLIMLPLLKKIYKKRR